MSANPLDLGEMTPHEQTLYEQVYVPAFTKQCADIGLEFSDVGDLHAALKTAAMVKLQDRSGRSSVIKEAAARMSQDMGLDVHERALEQMLAARDAGDQVAAQPNSAVHLALLDSLRTAPTA
jgi:hypothetical protein